MESINVKIDDALTKVEMIDDGEGVDFDESFAPMARLESIRILMSMHY